MRHDGGAQDAEREIEHLRIGDDIGGGRKAADYCAPVRIGQGDLDGEADRDDPEQRHDEGLDPAETEVLQP